MPTTYDEYESQQEDAAIGQMLSELELGLAQAGVVAWSAIGTDPDSGLVLVEVGGDTAGAFLPGDDCDLVAWARDKLSVEVRGEALPRFEDRIMALLRSGWRIWLQAAAGKPVPLTALRICRKLEASLQPTEQALAGLVMRGFVQRDEEGGYQLDQPYLTPNDCRRWEEESSMQFLARTRQDAAEYQKVVDPDFRIPGERIPDNAVGGGDGARYHARARPGLIVNHWVVWDCWTNSESMKSIFTPEDMTELQAEDAATAMNLAEPT